MTTQWFTTNWFYFCAYRPTFDCMLFIKQLICNEMCNFLNSLNFLRKYLSLFQIKLILSSERFKKYL